ELPKYKPRPPRPSKLDPYKDYLRARMAEGVFNANRLFNEIKSRCYLDLLNLAFCSGVIFSVAYWNMSLAAESFHSNKNASVSAGLFFHISRRNHPSPWCTTLSLFNIKGRMKSKSSFGSNGLLSRMSIATGTARLFQRSV